MVGRNLIDSHEVHHLLALILLCIFGPISNPTETNGLIQEKGGSKDRNEVTSWALGTKLGPVSLLHDS